MTGAGPPLDSATWRALWSRYRHTVEDLQAGRAEAVEEAIWFLEKRPRFHASGYLTERILQYVDRAPLTARQRNAVVSAAEAIVAEGRTRESWKALSLLVRLNVPGADTARTEARRRLVRFRGY